MVDHTIRDWIATQRNNTNFWREWYQLSLKTPSDIMTRESVKESVELTGHTIIAPTTWTRLTSCIPQTWKTSPLSRKKWRRPVSPRRSSLRSISTRNHQPSHTFEGLCDPSQYIHKR